MKKPYKYEYYVDCYFKHTEEARNDTRVDCRVFRTTKPKRRKSEKEAIHFGDPKAYFYSNPYFPRQLAINTPQRNVGLPMFVAEDFMNLEGASIQQKIENYY